MSLWTGTAVVAVMQYTHYGVWSLPKVSVCARQLQMAPAVYHAVHNFMVTEPYSLVEVNLVFGL